MVIMMAVMETIMIILKITTSTKTTATVAVVVVVVVMVVVVLQLRLLVLLTDLIYIALFDTSGTLTVLNTVMQYIR